MLTKDQFCLWYGPLPFYYRICLRILYFRQFLGLKMTATRLLKSKSCLQLPVRPRRWFAAPAWAWGVTSPRPFSDSAGIYPSRKTKGSPQRACDGYHHWNHCHANPWCLPLGFEQGLEDLHLPEKDIIKWCFRWGWIETWFYGVLINVSRRS